MYVEFEPSKKTKITVFFKASSLMNSKLNED